MQIRPEKDIAGLTHNRIITIKCKDNDEKTIERFRLSNYTRQHSDVRINGNQVILPENFSELAVVEVIPTDDKYETERVNLGKEDTILVKLKPKDYKVVFRMGNEDFETNRTMNPSLARSKWSGFDSDVDNTKKIIYFRAHGKPTERQQIHTTVEDPPFFERFSWLKYLIIGLVALLLGYGIYAGISAWGLHKTPWPFNGETEVKVENVNNNNNDNVNQDPVQPEQEETDKPEEDTSIDSAELMKHDVDYLKRESVWVKDSLQSDDCKALYEAISAGDIDKVIQLDSLLFDENNVRKEFKTIIIGLEKLNQTGNETKLKNAKDEMKRLSKNGSFNVGELLYSINSIVAKQPSLDVQEQKRTETPSSNQQPSKPKNNQSRRETSGD